MKKTQNDHLIPRVQVGEFVSSIAYILHILGTKPSTEAP